MGRHTYSFRAWIDERGSNCDREHARYCTCNGDDAHTHYVGVHRCSHLKLWDLNRRSDSRNILRVVRRRRPSFFLHVMIGAKFRGFKIGKGGHR